MSTEDTKVIATDLKTLLESLTDAHKAVAAGLDADIASIDAEASAIEKNVVAASEELGALLEVAERDIDALIADEQADRAEDEATEQK